MSSTFGREACMTLNKLPIDDLCAVLHYLDGGTIIRLYQSGDTFLRLKMRQGAVTTMILSDKRTFSGNRYPPCLSDFKSLRTLTISRKFAYSVFEPLCSGGSIAAAVRTLPKSLKHLSVSSVDSPLILLPPCIAVESFNSSEHEIKDPLACSYVNHPEALSNYLPHLESLVLDTPWDNRFKLSEFHLPLLPPNLLTLESKDFINLTSFETLPRGLTKLRLGGDLSITPASVATLPPNLTAFGTGASLDADSLLALPLSLTNLVIPTARFGLRELASLPRQLLACNVYSQFVRADDVLVLPPKLTVLTQYSETAASWNDEMLQNLPKTLTKMSLASPVTITNKNVKLVLPPLLTDLEMRGHFTANGESIHTLEGLRTLQIYGATFQNQLTLPSSLTILVIENESTLVKSLPPNLQILELRDVKTLLSTSSLQVLTKLRTLSIGNDMDGKILEDCPSSLDDLTCYVSENLLTALEWLSKSKITALWLGVRENLTLEMPVFSNALKILWLDVGNQRPTKEFFAALPRSLTELGILGSKSELYTENILAHLPRGLIYLKLDLQIHWRHLGDLPPRLERFGLEALLLSPLPEPQELNELQQYFERLPWYLELEMNVHPNDSLQFLRRRWVTFQQDRQATRLKC